MQHIFILKKNLMDTLTLKVLDDVIRRKSTCIITQKRTHESDKNSQVGVLWYKDAFFHGTTLAISYIRSLALERVNSTNLLQ